MSNQRDTSTDKYYKAAKQDKENSPDSHRYNRLFKSRLKQTATSQCLRKDRMTSPAQASQAAFQPLKTSTDLYMFTQINKDLEKMTRNNAENETIAIRNFITSIMEKSTLAKGDLLSLEKWLKIVSTNGINALNCALCQVNRFVVRFIGLVASENYAKAQQDNLRIVGNSQYSGQKTEICRTKQQLVRQFQQYFMRFKALYFHIAYVSNKFLYGTDLFPNITDNLFKKITDCSMKVRYLLGFLHKQVKQLESEVEKETIKSKKNVVSMHESNNKETRMANLCRALRKKYNMNDDIILERDGQLRKLQSVHVGINNIFKSKPLRIV